MGERRWLIVGNFQLIDFIRNKRYFPSISNVTCAFCCSSGAETGRSESGGGGRQGEEGAGVGTVENIVNVNLAVSILLK